MLRSRDRNFCYIRSHNSFYGLWRTSWRIRTEGPSTHVDAQPTDLSFDRLVDRTDAIPVLVEHLVWPPAFRPADRQLLARRPTSPAHPTRPGANWRTHESTRPDRHALVWGTSPPGLLSRGGGPQYRRLGHGPRPF